MPPARHAPLLLRLLGRPHVEHDTVTPLPPERRAFALAVLALRGDWVTRAELAALLWPALARARALANLRKALHLARAWPFAGELETSADAVRWRVATDLHQSERLAREGRLGDAIALRRGRLLDGFDAGDNAAWSEWLHAERAQAHREWLRLTRVHLAALAGDPQAAAAFARVLLDADPLDEDAVVALLGALRALQRFAEQREAYRDYAARLHDEIGVEPSARVAAELRRGGAARGGLVGRDAEIAAVAALLGAGGPRVVTIVGPGGVGKSTLLKAALRASAETAAAAWLALDDLADVAQALARLAAQIGVAPARDETPLQALRRHFDERPALLALDNCEHLAGLPAAVAALLAAPGVRIVATSRERLGVADEALFELRGLPVPAADDDVEAVLANDAVRLFAAAAATAKPGFDARTEAAAIADLVRSLGGLPLAILLAAHWVRRWQVADIAAEVVQSLDVLAVDDDGDERPEHRSVRATFQRSWQRLAAHEQRCLARLSVMPGTFTVAAAADVAGASLPLLAALADKSLLQFERGSRLSLHPLLRQHAAERLDADAAAAAQAAHAAHYLRRLGHLAPRAETGAAEVADEVGTELENARAAWRWAVAQRADDRLAAAVPALRHFHIVRALVGEGVALLETARRPDAAPLLTAHLELALAMLSYRGNRLDAAEAAARRGIAAAREIGRRDLLARCLSVRGTCAWQQGRLGAARLLLEQALRHAQRAGDARVVGTAQGNLALVERDLGNLERAAALMEDWLPPQRATGDPLRLSLGLNNLGWIRIALGHWEAARHALTEGLALCDRHGIALTRPGLLINLAEVQVRTGAYDDAERNCTLALALAATQPDNAAQACNMHTRVALLRGDIAAARARVRVAAAAALRTALQAARRDVVLCDAVILAAEGHDALARQRLVWYLAQPNLEPLDREWASSTLARLKRPARAAVAAPAIDLVQLLASIAAPGAAAPRPAA